MGSAEGVFLYSLASDSLASARRGALTGRGALANNQKKECFFVPKRASTPELRLDDNWTRILYETPLFVLCIHVANSYMSVSVAHYEEADSAIILRESSGLWRCRLENADNNPLWKMQSRLVCIYKWFGERLQMVGPHLEQWSDEPTFSSLSGHLPRVSWVVFAMQV